LIYTRPVLLFTLCAITHLADVMSEAAKSHIDVYVADKVKQMRKINRLSQLKLAAELDVSHSFIQQIEDVNHRAKYNIIHLNKLAQIFTCSPRDFLPENPI
jgi:DNA-binding XRE family transcriptional regulator